MCIIKMVGNLVGVEGQVGEDREGGCRPSCRRVLDGISMGNDWASAGEF